jgi:hypothetical protein
MGIRSARVAAALVALAVPLATAGCAVPVAGTPRADPAAVARPAPAPRPPGPEFRDAGGRFGLVPPAGWTVDTSGRQSTAVVFVDPRPTEAAGERFRTNINVIVLPARADLPGTLAAAREEVRALSDYRSTADEPATLSDGSPAHVLGGTYVDPRSGLALRNVQLLAVHGAETVVVTGTTLAQAWPGRGPVLEASLRSLTVVA